MRKEVLYAVVAGISIGLIAAFGTWRISKLVKIKPTPINKIEVPTPKNIDTLTIDGLKNYDVVTDDPIIKGLTSPDSSVVISTNDTDYYTKSNSEGEFEIAIETPSGMSAIKINDQKLILIYSTDVETNKVAYVGTITDISAETIQVRGNKGEILQVSTNNSTRYINNLRKDIEVKMTDLAIGDYVVAIGDQATNKVLTANRILVASPLVDNKIEVQRITIEKITKNVINDIKLPAKWNGPNIKELEVGEEVILVGIRVDEKTYTLRSIFKTVE